MKAVVKLEGLKDLDKMLAGFSDRMTSGVLNRTLAKAAAPIVEEAKRLVPVKTGKLKKAIGASKRSTVEASGRIKDGEAKIFIGVSGYPAEYAEEIEYGAVELLAQPFMRPAWEAKKDEAIKIVQSELKIEIEKTRARAEKRAAKKAVQE